MRIVIILILFFIINPLSAQNKGYYQRFQEIISELDNNNIHSALQMMDDFLKDYPQEKSMYYNRGLAKLFLNQINAAKKDFQLARGLSNDSTIEFWLSKEYAANEMAENYMGKTRLLMENNLKPKFGRSDSLRGFLFPERSCFNVTFYDLKLKVLPKEKKIIGRNYIYFDVVDKTRKIQIDLFENYMIDSILDNGASLSFKREFNAVFIDFNEEMKAGEKHNIQIYYSGIPREAPNPPWNGGFVWKKKKNTDWIGVSCEHLGASSWWPNKDHCMSSNKSAPFEFIS